MMHGCWNGPMGFGWIGGVFMLIFWVLIIAVVVLFIRRMVLSRSCYGGDFADTSSAALEILKQRYAKGEIDKKEFEEKKRDLTRD